MGNTIDTLTTLSLLMQSKKGVYALLVGSGVSRSSGILTGWEILLDLIHKLRILSKDSSQLDDITWYKKHFNNDPDYSDLLSKVAKTSEDRRNLLDSYFEPTENDREDGLKVPGKAHKAIADLVALGFIRVIITTNFDRLLERAMEERGISPYIVSSPDMIEGLPSVIHNACTIIKLHGDYKDSRMKNLSGELSSYDKRVTDLLTRIFQEYGLLISGWSGEWDKALNNLVVKQGNRRFSSYITVRGEGSHVLDKLEKSGISKIPIVDAESFFQDLRDRIVAIEEISNGKSMNSEVAIALLKRYISGGDKIRLRDFLLNEAKDAKNKIDKSIVRIDSILTKDQVREQVKEYEDKMEKLVQLYMVGYYWGDDTVAEILRDVFSLFLTFPNYEGTYYEDTERLRYYPALLLLYAAGLGAVSGKKYHLLQQLLLITMKKNGEETPLVYRVYPSGVIRELYGKLLRDNEREYTPTTNHLIDYFKGRCNEILVNDDDFDDLFDKMEYLLALVSVDMRLVADMDPWGFPGRFAWKRYYPKSPAQVLMDQYSSEKNDWSVLKQGMFGGSSDRFVAAWRAMEDFISRIGWRF